MIPHPSTFAATAAERRQDLLALAARERLAATVADQTPRAPLLPPLWRLIAHAIRMTGSGLSVQPRPRAWTQV